MALFDICFKRARKKKLMQNKRIPQNGELHGFFEKKPKIR